MTRARSAAIPAKLPATSCPMQRSNPRPVSGSNGRAAEAAMAEQCGSRVGAPHGTLRPLASGGSTSDATRTAYVRPPASAAKAKVVMPSTKAETCGGRIERATICRSAAAAARGRSVHRGFDRHRRTRSTNHAERPWRVRRSVTPRPAPQSSSPVMAWKHTANLLRKSIMSSTHWRHAAASCTRRTDPGLVAGSQGWWRVRDLCGGPARGACRSGAAPGERGRAAACRRRARATRSRACPATYQTIPEAQNW